MNKDIEGVNTSDDYVLGYLLAITAAILLGIVYVLLRLLSLRNVNPLFSPFYFGPSFMLLNL